MRKIKIKKHLLLYKNGFVSESLGATSFVEGNPIIADIDISEKQDEDIEKIKNELKKDKAKYQKAFDTKQKDNIIKVERIK